MTKAVLFDYDGTLANSLPIFIPSYKEALEHFGFNLSDEEIIKTCYGKTEDIICEVLGISGKVEEFVEFYFNGVKKHMQNVQLFDDTIQILEYLKGKNINFGLVSMAHKWYIEESLERLGLDKYLRVRVTFDDVKNIKPDPEAVQKACEALNIDPKDSMVIGDTKGDVKMGQNAGSLSVLYIPEENSKFYNFNELIEESDPDKTAKKLIDLKDLIAS